MKQARPPRTTASPTRPGQTPPRPTQGNAKEWSVRVAIRLPHKIGQPLGSDSASDGTCGTD